MVKDIIFLKPKTQKVIKKRIMIVIMVIFAILIIFAFFTGDRNLRHFLQLKSDINQLEQDIAKLEEENLKLEEMIELMNKDPYYIEKIAREELKKAKEDETIIEFQDEEELEVDQKKDPDK